MTRLPIPGSDSGSWGDILNDFLRVEHNDDGTLKTTYIAASQKGQPGGIAELDGSGRTYTLQLGTGLASSSTFLRGDQSWQAISKSDVGLANVDNTTDLNKPISTATQGALDLKANSSDLPGKVDKSGDTMSGGLAVGTNTAPLTIGDGSNVSVGVAFQGTRAQFGYDAVGYAVLQGGGAKGIRFNVNSATFGAGTVATFDTAGQFTLSTSGMSAASGTQTAMTISPSVNQSGTASYTLLSINPSVVAIGSGVNYLIDAQTASSPRFQVSANTGAVNQALVTAPNGSGDVALAIQNNATTANETASLNFYTTTNLASVFGRIRVSRVDSTTSRMSLGPITASTVANHINMYGDNGYMSLGAGSVPANGLVTVGSNTTAATGGLWFGTDVNLYRSGANVITTDDAMQVLGSSLYASGNLTVGSGTASATITLRGTGYNGVTTDIYSDSASAYSYFRRARGTFAAPTLTTSGSYLGSFGFRGHDGTNWIVQDAARISSYATQSFSTTHGGAIGFFTAANGTLVSNGASERLTIYHDGNVGVGVTAPTFKLQLAAATTAAGGIGFGADTNLYRSAVDTLKTDDAFDAASFRVGGAAGASGSFTTVDGKTVTVTNGLITSIV